LRRWLKRRQKIAKRYDEAFADLSTLKPLRLRQGVSHAYHLYVISFDLEKLRVKRERLFKELRADGIGVNIHYIPVHLHPFYRERFGTGAGLCPVAEGMYERVMSLPIFPSMTDWQIDEVIQSVKKVVGSFSR
jgi:perosamine synthetase